jgi:[acyl-carrier-protein] S-malonyltransferase
MIYPNSCASPLLDHEGSLCYFDPHMKTCLLFPGQGAQYPGMGKDLWDASDPVKKLFSKASKAAEMDLEKLLFQGSAEDLQATDKTQVAITLVSLCSALFLREKGIAPDGFAGFSLGEYAALHEAGVIGLDHLFPIVKIRGELMEKAARNLDSPSGKPGMAAVVGLAVSAMTEAVKPMEKDGVYLANFNSPVQAVLSGSQDGLAKAEAALKAAGAKRVIRLKVSGPFHSPYMESAAREFEEALGSFPFAEPKLPVYSNVTGARISTGAEARQMCRRQIVSPVQWVTVEESLLADGFTRFLEAGPGTVLTGLFKALKSDVNVGPAGKSVDIAKIPAA